MSLRMPFLLPGALPISLLLPLSLFAGRTETLRVDYESGTLDSGVSNLRFELPTNRLAITISTEARSGRYAVRTEVGSSADFVTFGKPRAESFSMDLLETRYSEGEDWEYGFSLRIDPAWKFDDEGAAEIVWQFKRFEGGPDHFVAVKKKAVVIRTFPNGQFTLVDLTKTKPGTWMDFRFAIHWSTKDDGRMLVDFKEASSSKWTRVAENLGPNLRNAQPKAAYLKWGLYRPEAGLDQGKACSTPSFNPRIVWHDDIYAIRLDPPR